MANGAIVTQGTRLYRYDEVHGVWDRVRGVSSFSGPNTSKSKIDVTSFDSHRKEYLYGIPDEGDISFNLFFYPTDPIHKAILKEDVAAAYNRMWRITLSDGTSYTFSGNVSSAPLSGDLDAAVSWSLTISVSGDAEWNFLNDLGTISWDSSLAGTASSGAVTGNVKATLASNSDVSLTFAAGPFSAGTHYNIANVPEGLTPVLTRTSSSVATLTFTGNATDKEDVTDISLTFLDAAFENNLATDVTGYKKDNIAITFA